MQRYCSRIQRWREICEVVQNTCQKESSFCAPRCRSWPRDTPPRDLRCAREYAEPHAPPRTGPVPHPPPRPAYRAAHPHPSGCASRCGSIWQSDSRRSGHPAARIKLEPSLDTFALRGDPLRHPFRRRSALQVVIQELLNVDVEVGGGFFIDDRMMFSIILEHPYLLLQPAERREELHAFSVRDCRIRLVMHHQQRRGDLIRIEDRRILNITLPSIP